MAGLKFRVPASDIFLEMLREFGANPTPLAYGAVFSALETGLIDGAENNIRSFHSSRHFEGAKFWSRSEHCYAPDVLLISRRTLDALGKPRQDLLREVATESVQVMRRLWDQGEAVARTALDDGGVQYNEVDVDAFRAAVAPLLMAYRRDDSVRDLLRQIQELA
jgi:TRAP-type C4-dicarboxylate transport system substrate-binding protein